MQFTCCDNIFRVKEKQRDLTQLLEACICFSEDGPLKVRWRTHLVEKLAGAKTETEGQGASGQPEQVCRAVLRGVAVGGA